MQRVVRRVLIPLALAAGMSRPLPAQQLPVPADSVRTVYVLLVEVTPRELSRRIRQDWADELADVLRQTLRLALPDTVVRRIAVETVTVEDSVGKKCGSADCEFLIFLEELVERSIQTRLTLYPEYTNTRRHSRKQNISQPYPEDCGRPVGDPWLICRGNFEVYAGQLVNARFNAPVQPRGTP